MGNEEGFRDEGRHEDGHEEGYEGYEGEGQERHCQGQKRQGKRLLGQEAEDGVGPHEGQADEEQGRQGRVEEGLRCREGALREERPEGVGGRSKEGSEGAEPNGLRRHRGQVRGRQGSLRQGPALRHWSSTGRFSLCSQVGTIFLTLPAVVPTRRGAHAWPAQRWLYMLASRLHLWVKLSRTCAKTWREDTPFAVLV